VDPKTLLTRTAAIACISASYVCATACVGSDPGSSSGSTTGQKLTHAEFFAKLPDAVCDYYVRCGRKPAAERADCPRELYDDVERDYACAGARGLYPDLADSLAACLKSEERPCAKTDDLDLFCPNLRLMENECQKKRDAG
jgi:hypothetical protein